MKTEYKGFIISVKQDEIAESPREWDNLGTMYCCHRNYNLGDKQFKSGVALLEELSGLDSDYRKGSMEQWKERAETYISKKYIWLPLYLYDHSGITMATTPFHCPWDSGQVGIIAVSRDKVRKEYGLKRITSKWEEKVLEFLNGEVKTYDQFLTGDIYYYDIEGEDFSESCGGYYGEDECLKEAKSIVDYHVNKAHGNASTEVGQAV